jgi:hypothetical protein
MPLTAPSPYQGELEASHGDIAYLYVIKHLGDGVKFHYTNHSGNISVTNLPADLGANPQVFEAAQVRHSGRGSREEYEGQGFDVQLGIYEDRVPRMFYASIPRGIEVTVIKVAQGILQDASPSVDYAQHCLITQGGIAQQVTLSGQIASITAVPVPYSWPRKIPRYWFQRPCNHILYDAATCGVDPTLHDWTSTIVALERVRRRITLTGQMPAVSADYFSYGWLRHAASGEDSAFRQRHAHHCKDVEP